MTIFQWFQRIWKAIIGADADIKQEDLDIKKLTSSMDNFSDALGGVILEQKKEIDLLNEILKYVKPLPPVTGRSIIGKPIKQ